MFSPEWPGMQAISKTKGESKTKRKQNHHRNPVDLETAAGIRTPGNWPGAGQMDVRWGLGARRLLPGSVLGGEKYRTLPKKCPLAGYGGVQVASVFVRVRAAWAIQRVRAAWAIQVSN